MQGDYDHDMQSTCRLGLHELFDHLWQGQSQLFWTGTAMHVKHRARGIMVGMWEGLD